MGNSSNVFGLALLAMLLCGTVACGDNLMPAAEGEPDASIDGGDEEPPPPPPIEPPVAVDDEVEVAASTEWGLDEELIDLLGNDENPDSSSSLTVVGVAGNAGLVAVRAQGVVNYWDTSRTQGAVDSFTYAITNGPVERGFNVDIYDVATVSSLAGADSIITSQEPTTSSSTSFIDFGNGGHFKSNTGIPGSPDKDFVAHGNGYFYALSSGPQTIGVNVDDGIRVRLEGVSLTQVSNATQVGDDGFEVDGGNGFGTFSIPASGWYRLEFVYYHDKGGERLEIFSADGAAESFDDETMTLVGDGARVVFQETPRGSVVTATVDVSTLEQAAPEAGDFEEGVYRNNSEDVDVMDEVDDPTGDPIHLIGVHTGTGVAIRYGDTNREEDGDCCVYARYFERTGTPGVTDTLNYTVVDGRVSRGLTFSTYTSAGAVDSLADAEDTIASGTFLATETSNHVDRYNNYPGGPGDNFASEITGYIYIPAADSYSFRVYSDDGFSLRIPGSTVATVVDGTALATDTFGRDGEGIGDTFGVMTFSEAGFYPMRIVHFEHEVDAQIELYSAQGARTSYDSDYFKFVGFSSSSYQQSYGGLSVFTEEPGGRTATATVTIPVE